MFAAVDSDIPVGQFVILQEAGGLVDSCGNRSLFCIHFVCFFGVHVKADT